MKDAVDEGHAKQGPDGGAVGLGGADDARKVLVEFGLLGENPADDSARGLWRGAAKIKLQEA